MSLLYSPYDASTFLILEGDQVRYLDLFATSGVYDAAMMAVGYDDSAWSRARQPFVAHSTDPAIPDRFDGSTWDDFGIEYGPNGFIPTGYTSPNSHRWVGTTVAGGGVGERGEIVGRVNYTVPAGLPSPFDLASSWFYLAAWYGALDIWVDGYRTDSLTSGTMIGSGRAGRHLHGATVTIPDSVVAPGTHLLGFHGNATAASNFLASVMMAVPHRIISISPRLRQFPRDDALGNAPRPGRESSSVQATARQGWPGTYR